jgi:hypothetical protein
MRIRDRHMALSTATCPLARHRLFCSRSGLCVTPITIAARIASPELFPDAEALPHLICSLPDRGGGGRDEPGKHGDTR